LLAPLGESEERDRLLAEALTLVLYLGSYEGITSDEARQCFAEALPCCRRGNDVAALVALYGRYAFFLGGLGDMDECMRYSREAIRVADESGDPIARLTARAASVYWFVQSGQLSVALQAADEGLALLEPAHSVPIIPNNDPVVVLRVFRGWALAPMGRFADAEQVLGQALERAEKAGSLSFMALAHAAMAQVGENRGRLEMMRTHARQTLDLGLQIGSPRMQNLGYLNWALYLLRSGQPREALVQFEEMRSRVEKYTVTREAEALNLAGVARAQADAGDRAAGRKTAGLAVDTAVRNGTRYYEAVARLERARILLGDDPTERVEVGDELRRAETLVEETKADSLRPSIRLEQANLAWQAGSKAEYERLLEESRALFAEMEATGHVERIDALRRELKND
jgi:tetratricopeptide (TPR) repeat protein